MNTKFFFEKEENNFLAFLNEKQYSQIILLADAKTNGFCLPVLKHIFPSLQHTWSIIIPDGESNKTIDVCKLIWEGLDTYRADKNTLLINVGGGMLSDIGGFTASTFKRGISFINIPTTLLAMADASHGGKTGIDFNGIKNMIGTFQHPEAVYINPVFLNTLAERNLRSGIAEILKHSLLKGSDYFDEIVGCNEKDFYTADVIRKAVLFKNDIVAQDEKDNHIRQTLNLGHTIGHALESFSLMTLKPLLHGEAVMLGLVHELMLSKLIFDFPDSVIDEVIRFKERVYPDVHLKFTYEEIEKYILNDKKNTSEIKMSLLKRVGECKWQVAVTAEQIESAIKLTNSLLVK